MEFDSHLQSFLQLGLNLLNFLAPSLAQLQRTFQNVALQTRQNHAIRVSNLAISPRRSELGPHQAQRSSFLVLFQV